MRYISGIGDKVVYKSRVHPDAYKLNKEWKLPLNKVITLEEEVPDYLKERNVDAKLCQRFDLRDCSAGFYRYKDFNDRTRFVDFSNRIIIPVRDIDDNLVTFQGRDKVGSADKKYLFPNMLPGTGRYIYNANYAKKNKAQKVVLSEGVFDVFAVTKALESDLAYKDFAACGTFGKHLSISEKNVLNTDQLTDLFKLQEAGVAEFIILWDGEIAAVKAAIEAALKLNNFGLNTTVARLHGNLDPADTDASTILDAIDARKKPTKFDLLKIRLGIE
jgi:DNA primase